VGSQVLIFGGTAIWGQTALVEQYELATQTGRMDSAWVMPNPASHAGAAVIGTGTAARIYVVGGWHTSATDMYDSPSGTLQIFNPNDGTWTLGKPLPEARGGPAVVAYRGKLYVIGGRDRKGVDVNTT